VWWWWRWGELELVLGRGRVLRLGFGEGGERNLVIRWGRWRLLGEPQQILGGLEAKDVEENLRQWVVEHEEWELGQVKFDQPSLCNMT